MQSVRRSGVNSCLEVPPDSSQLLDFCRTSGEEQRAQELLTVLSVLRSDVEVHVCVLWMSYNSRFKFCVSFWFASA